jgi:hypothetical protein
MEGEDDGLVGKENRIEIEIRKTVRTTEHHYWMLRVQREQLELLEAQIAKLEHRSVSFCPTSRQLGRPMPGKQWPQWKSQERKRMITTQPMPSARATSHSKNTYLSAQFRRLAPRKGKKRAIVAVGHTILVIVFHMLKNQQPYRDLGADSFDRRNAEQLKRSLVRRLERLGVQVSIVSTAPAPQAA